MLAQVEYEVTKNDIKSSVVRLTDVKLFIPETAYVNKGLAPDPSHPPMGKAPIKITWGDKDDFHFVSQPHGHAPKPRNEAVDEFFAKYDVQVGTILLIKVPRAGHIIVEKA